MPKPYTASIIAIMLDRKNAQFNCFLAWEFIILLKIWQRTIIFCMWTYNRMNSSLWNGRQIGKIVNAIDKRNRTACEWCELNRICVRAERQSVWRQMARSSCVSKLLIRMAALTPWQFECICCEPKSTSAFLCTVFIAVCSRSDRYKNKSKVILVHRCKKLFNFCGLHSRDAVQLNCVKRFVRFHGDFRKNSIEKWWAVNVDGLCMVYRWQLVIIACTKCFVWYSDFWMKCHIIIQFNLFTCWFNDDIAVVSIFILINWPNMTVNWCNASNRMFTTMSALYSLDTTRLNQSSRINPFHQ